MDRHYRYPRRACPGGSARDTVPAPSPRSQSLPQGHPPVENCLCQGQPISLAMSYVKVQPFEGLYEPCEALRQGTLFQALNMPYCIGGRRR